jgi:hypothetical protein
MKWMMILVFLVSMLIMVGCGAEAPEVESTTLTPAAQTLQSYLQALVEKDEDTLVQMTCADWEANALLEFDAFGGVETSLDGLSCEQVDGGVGLPRWSAREKSWPVIKMKFRSSISADAAIKWSNRVAIG